MLLQEFEDCLRDLTSGSMTLVDSFGVSRLAMRKAIRAAFATPEVRKMFEQQNSRALRVRLEQLKSDQRLHKIDADTYKCVASFCVSLQRRWLIPWTRVCLAGSKLLRLWLR